MFLSSQQDQFYDVKMRIIINPNLKINLFFHKKSLINKKMLFLQRTRSFSTLKQIYTETVSKKGMKVDTKQLEVKIDSLQRLNDKLVLSHPKWKQYAAGLSFKMQQPNLMLKKNFAQQNKSQGKKNFFSIFNRSFSTYSTDSLRVPGLYLFGGSGCGKSFLSDMFYDNLAIQEKKRVHFHEFMGSIHSQLFQLEREKKGFDPLISVARNTAQKIRLLYLDQFQVTDVADASILKRLFEQLIGYELVLLATSNRHPTELYKNGHQREFFVPFIDFLMKNCQIQHLDSQKDYRYELEVETSDLKTSYIHPVNQQTDKKLKRIFALLVGEKNPVFEEKIITTEAGRALRVPFTKNNVCYYEFNDLVEKVMGDTDFRAICQNFKAIVIRNMRQIKRNERDIANRMIKLFDEAYFRHVKLYINGETDIQNIIQAFPESECRNEEDFAMTRCKSRLMEFQTKKYNQELSEIELKQAKAAKNQANPPK